MILNPGLCGWTQDGIKNGTNGTNGTDGTTNRLTLTLTLNPEPEP